MIVYMLMGVYILPISSRGPSKTSLINFPFSPSHRNSFSGLSVTASSSSSSSPFSYFSATHLLIPPVSPSSPFLFLKCLFAASHHLLQHPIPIPTPRLLLPFLLLLSSRMISQQHLQLSKLLLQQCVNDSALSICINQVLLQLTPIHHLLLLQVPLLWATTRLSMITMLLIALETTMTMRKNPNLTRRPEDERSRSNLFRTNRDVI